MAQLQPKCRVRFELKRVEACIIYIAELIVISVIAFFIGTLVQLLYDVTVMIMDNS